VQVDEFMREHRHCFSGYEGPEQEHCLEAHAIYKAYEAMIDGMLEAFCASEGLDCGHALLAALQQELRGKPLSNLRGSYVKTLLSDGTFEGFLRIMLEYVAATRTTAEESAHCSPLAAATAPRGSPYAGWTPEESIALADAGLLPSFPLPGDPVWAFCASEESPPGEWLA
ncbi:unnamed protein product, partial [Polarella glacialis]